MGNGERIQLQTIGELKVGFNEGIAGRLENNAQKRDHKQEVKKGQSKNQHQPEHKLKGQTRKSNTNKLKHELRKPQEIKRNYKIFGKG